MGQAATREVKDVIPELKDVTLKGVIPLNHELGRGAYGRVFTVKYGGVVCAAKEIHPLLIELCSIEGKQRIKDNFIRECICCSSIQHPNIVQFLGVYYFRGFFSADPKADRFSLPVMVMELMDIDLTFFLEKNASKIVFATKISILYDVSLGLSFLHNHKPPIVHCDLSSNNILLTGQLVAKIGDLGVAKIMQDPDDKKSRGTQAPGTNHFMPPEALEDNPVYGTPVDVFSFGGIALHVFSEKWPAPCSKTKLDPETRRIYALTESERRQAYFEEITGEPAALRRMIEQCLDDDPNRRPPIQEVATIIGPLKVSTTATYLCYLTIIVT